MSVKTRYTHSWENNSSLLFEVGGQITCFDLNAKTKLCDFLVVTTGLIVQLKKIDGVSLSDNTEILLGIPNKRRSMYFLNQGVIANKGRDGYLFKSTIPARKAPRRSSLRTQFVKGMTICCKLKQQEVGVLNIGSSGALVADNSNALEKAGVIEIGFNSGLVVDAEYR